MDTIQHQNQQHDTETLILQAAEKEFLDKGYAGAKTTDIAHAAGVTHAMLHYYFRTKDKLFERIVADKMDKLCETMIGTISKWDPAQSLEERITQMVECHFDFIAANRDVPRFLINEIHVHPERLELIKSTLCAKASALVIELQTSIDTLANDGKCRQTDARMLVFDMVSLNAFPFLSSPIITPMTEIMFGSYEDFLAKRRQENVRTILDKLQLR